MSMPFFRVDYLGFGIAITQTYKPKLIEDSHYYHHLLLSKESRYFFLNLPDFFLLGEVFIGRAITMANCCSIGAAHTRGNVKVSHYRLALRSFRGRMR